MGMSREHYDPAVKVDGVRVKVPASTANLGPGFDSLGLALNLYTTLELRAAAETTIHLYGDELAGPGKDIPRNKSNLIYEVAQQVFAHAGVSVPELHIAMHSDIPLTRGLGSSASAIVAALLAANALIGEPLSRQELFQLASAMEKHPDNVGASLFGGFIAAYWDGERAEHIRIEPDDRLEVLVAIPQFQLSTSKARGVMPKEISMHDAVYNIGHSNVLVAALATGRLDLIKHAMKDKLHQPYRSTLVPGMSGILEEAVNYGALGVALSGAGPTMLALVERANPDKNKLESFFRDSFAKEKIEIETLWLTPDKDGPQVEILSRANESLLELSEHVVRDEGRERP